MPDRHAGAELAPIDREVCGRCGAAAWRVAWRAGMALQHVDQTVDGDHWPVLGHWTPSEPGRFAARRLEEEAAPSTALAVPEPEVRARPAAPDEVPKGAHDVEKWARERGWTTTLMYARGPLVGNDGAPRVETERVLQWTESGEPVLTPTGQQAYKNEKTDRIRLTETVVLRAWRKTPGGTQATVAAWRDGKSELTYRLTPYAVRITIPELRAMLDTDEHDPVVSTESPRESETS